MTNLRNSVQKDLNSLNGINCLLLKGGNKMNKAIYIAPALLILTVASVLATAGIFDLREATNETKDVSIYSNGVTGSGYIIDGMNGNSRITYQFEQTNGTWQERTQIGRIRGNWQPVTLDYNSTAGTVNITQLGLAVNVINRK